MQPLSDCDYFTRFTDNSFFFVLTEYFTRKSKDLVLNTYGRYLYEFCHNYDLFILNGFCKSDLAGNFTFTSPNGQSVIDYFIVSQNILQCDIDLNVIANITSWHLPLVFSLNFSCKCQDTLLESPDIENAKRIVWDNNLSPDYMSNVNKLLNDNVIASLSGGVFSNINNVVSSLSGALLESADFMSRTFYNNSNMLSVKYSWFDHECLQMKRNVNKLLKISQNNQSTFNRQQYVNKRN